MIIKVDESNISQAAHIHSVSWQESHRSFCTPEFIELHSPEHQEQYLREKMENGTTVFMLEKEKPVGIVSITGSLIEDLYVLPEWQNKGFGTELLEFAIGQCSEDPTLWILENNVDAGRLYLRKGFQLTGRKNEITDKLDEIEFVLHKGREYVIRPEEEKDFEEVENLVREAFWNVYRPGCAEHYLIHVLRTNPAFVQELDFVMEQDGRIIGQNVFVRAYIEKDDGEKTEVLTMGPISIAPELKGKGYGRALLDYSLEKASKLGYGAVLIEGNIGFYGGSGFIYSREKGIRYHGLPEGADDSFFLCRELREGYLDEVTGVYQTPECYFVKDEDIEEFDRKFPAKEKLVLPGQLG